MLFPEECMAVSRKFRPHADYLAELEMDFAQIEPHLPEKVDSILDIGCGLAGIDVYLKRKYPKAYLTLLDKDGNDAVFCWDGTPYGSRREAEMLLEANNFKVDRWLPAGTTEPLKADLVVSLLAWGFHFPLDTYKVSGFCIADLRKGKEEPRGVVISENSKVARCAFQC
jgi:hypothetical protein